MICSFFGHRIVPAAIEMSLRMVLTDLIENRGVDLFYVGNHGDFDSMARRIIKELAAKYPIQYRVVLAYLPGKADKCRNEDYGDTVFPEGIETVPYRFAITYCNKWMVMQADYEKQTKQSAGLYFTICSPKTGKCGYNGRERKRKGDIYG